VGAGPAALTAVKDGHGPRAMPGLQRTRLRGGIHAPGVRPSVDPPVGHHRVVGELRRAAGAGPAAVRGPAGPQRASRGAARADRGGRHQRGRRARRAAAGRAQAARDPAPGSLRARAQRAARAGAAAGPGGTARYPIPDPGRSGRSKHDLLPALRRLPRRAAQGGDRQGAHPRPHPRAGLRLPARLHHLRLAGRHAQLGHLGRALRAASRSHGALPAQRSGGSPRVGHGQDAGILAGAGPGRPAPEGEAEPARHRQPVLGDLARHRGDRADRRQELRDHRDLPDRLRRPHLAHVGLGPLPLRHRSRRADQRLRPLHGPAGGGRPGQDRHRGALGRDLQGSPAGRTGTRSAAPTGRRNT
jgi:hypothetical protein